MARISNIIPFPDRLAEAASAVDAIEQEHLKRAAELPAWLKALDVEWIYRDLARREAQRKRALAKPYWNTTP